MDRKELLFTASFVICLALVTYFLGNSLTGYVVQSTGSGFENMEIIMENPTTLNYVVLYSVITAAIIIIGVVYFREKYA